jgi:hypothetical protein
MLTTSERMTSLEEKMDKVLKLLNPEREEPASNQELLAKFEIFQEEMNRYLSDLKPTSDATADIEAEPESFYRNMWLYGASGFVFSAILTAFTFKFATELFSLAFSLFFAFSIVCLGLLHDKYLLPGNTIRRIASNAISASIFWLAFTIASVAGFSIGNSIISDPFGGEERGSRQEQIRHNDNSTAPASSFELPVGEGNASEQ